MAEQITFFNTFEEPIALFETLLPRLDAAGVRARAVISAGRYRQTPWLEDPVQRRRYLRLAWVPGFQRRSKRACALWYWLLVPPRILFSRSRLHVLLTEPPFLFALGVWLSRLRRIPCAVFIMDLHLDTAAALGLVRVGSPLYRLLDAATRWGLRHADRVWALGRCMQERLLAKGVAAERLRLAPLWALPAAQRPPAEPNRFLAAHGWEGKFLVLYSGNMGLGHELRTVLEAAARLRDCRDMLFVFAGYGGRRAEVASAIAAGADNVRLLDFQPEDWLADMLAAAGAHFVSLRPGCEGAVVPSKFFGALASGRPVLYEGRAEGEVARLIRELGCGRVIAPRDTAALCEALLAYRGDAALARRDGAAGRAAFLARYTAEQGAQRCLALLRELLPAPPAEAGRAAAPGGAA